MSSTFETTEADGIRKPDSDFPHGLTTTRLSELHPNTVLYKSELAAALGVSPRTVQRMVDRCELPAGVQLGRRKAWVSGTLLDYIAERSKSTLVEAREIARRLAE